MIIPYQNIRDIAFLRHEISEYMRVLRKEAVSLGVADNGDQILLTSIKRDYCKNVPRNRLVIYLKGTGCSWAKEGGGCTFCGFWNMTNFGDPFPYHDIESRLEDALVRNIHSNYSVVAIYNDGSLLDPTEISPTTLDKILNITVNKDYVEEIVIECKVGDISDCNLQRITSVIGEKHLSVALGFESASELVRQLCINKRDFTNTQFAEAIYALRKYRCKIIPLLMFKPPFLSTEEACFDFVNSLKYLEQFSVDRIDMELPTVQRHTMLHSLWERQLYHTPTYWDVVAVIQAKHCLGLASPLYIAPQIYTPELIDTTKSCPRCADQIASALIEYNKNNDLCAIENLECDCRNLKQTKLSEISASAIIKRVRSQLETLSRPRGCPNRRWN